MNFCTYFDRNYLAKGLALHASLERHAGDYRLWVLALDDDAGRAMSARPNVTVVPFASFETPELRRATADRSVAERCWTYTPWLMKRLLEEGLDHVAYLDADLYFFSDPRPVFEEIGHASAAIAPNRFSPGHSDLERWGTYNVGLVYAGQAGRACVDEWAELCLGWCYARFDDNPYHFGDQAYWDYLVPKYGVHVIRHPGADLAPWNVEGHRCVVRDGHLYVDGWKLVFYHFHGYRSRDERWPSAFAVPESVVGFVYGAYDQELGRIEEV